MRQTLNTSPLRTRLNYRSAADIHCQRPSKASAWEHHLGRMSQLTKAQKTCWKSKKPRIFREQGKMKHSCSKRIQNSNHANIKVCWSRNIWTAWKGKCIANHSSLAVSILPVGDMGWVGEEKTVWESGVALHAAAEEPTAPQAWESTTRLAWLCIGASDSTGEKTTQTCHRATKHRPMVQCSSLPWAQPKSPSSPQTKRGKRLIHVGLVFSTDFAMLVGPT